MGWRVGYPFFIPSISLRHPFDRDWVTVLCFVFFRNKVVIFRIADLGKGIKRHKRTPAAC